MTLAPARRARFYSPRAARQMQEELRAMVEETCRSCGGTGLVYDDFEGAVFSCFACNPEEAP